MSSIQNENVKGKGASLMSIELNLSSQPLSEPELDAIERKLGCTLPEDYRAFILAQNGGVPDHEMVFDFFDEAKQSENTSVIREFFPFFSDSDEGVSPTLVHAYENLSREELMPTYVLPIADDPFGNIVSISLQERDHGAVYYFDHDSEDADTGYMVASKLSDSLAGFLDLLKCDTE